MKALLPLKIK